MRKFTSKEKQRIVSLYQEGLSTREVAEILRCNRQAISAILKEEGIVIRGYSQEPSDPTPEEIEEATAEIRKGWEISDTRDGRDDIVHHWTPPVVSSKFIVVRRGY
jgi:transposase-like protein